MYLIDEKKNLPVRFHNLIEHRLQTFLKFTAEFRSCNKRTHIQRIKCLVLERFRHISGDYTACKSLDNRGLAYTRLTYEYRIVLRAA